MSIYTKKLEDEIIRDYLDGVYVVKIGQKYQIPISHVPWILGKNHVELRGYYKKRPEFPRERKVAEDYRNGLSTKQIHLKYEIPESYIAWMLGRCRIKLRKPTDIPKGVHIQRDGIIYLPKSFTKELGFKDCGDKIRLDILDKEKGIVQFIKTSKLEAEG